MNSDGTLICDETRSLIENTESVFGRAYDLFVTIADHYNHLLLVLSNADTVPAPGFLEDVSGGQSSEDFSESISRTQDLVRTAEQLKSLSESVLKETKMLKGREDAGITALLEMIEEFKSLCKRLIMPEQEWTGESESRLVDEWRRVREDFFLICHQCGSLTLEKADLTAPEKLLEIPVATSQGTKRISVVHGNLCDCENQFDIVVCSAFKNEYSPVAGTLIGELMYKKNLSVRELSRDCELDLRTQGAWLSKETDSCFRRIACIELLGYSNRKYTELVNIKSAFSTLHYLIEQAALEGIPVRTIALPVIGSGNQQLDAGYIISPLVTYCLRMLRNIEETEEIIFYELNGQKADFIADRLREINDNESKSDVFISYSSKQYDIAIKIYRLLTENSIRCWMAPQSIPAGSQYYLEISKAINSIKLLLLVLTQDAVNSRFVPKEIGASIGAGKMIAPFQVGEVRLENGFDFLLEGEQIKPVGEIGQIDLDGILQEVKRKLS